MRGPTAARGALRLALALSLALSPALTGCGVEPDLDPDLDPNTVRSALPRGAEGKADSTGCAGSCGKQSAAGCWCDAKCATYGDCCADKVQTCDAQASASCKGHCGGTSDAGCWCDAKCATYGDCCQDKTQICDGSTPTPAPGVSCASPACSGAACSALVSMPGSYSASSNQAQQEGYYIGTSATYAFLRQDLVKLVRWAACEVKARFPGTAPLAFTDMAQADGKTPGVDVGQPRHPTSTHTGRDIDVAYYQTDGSNNAQIICGAGTDNNYNGYPGAYNDGYFCTTSANIVDWDRQVWFLAKLFEHDKARVFGVDQTLPQQALARAKQYYSAGQISKTVHDRFSAKLAWGQAGGWSFHHHHIHMSFY